MRTLVWNADDVVEVYASLFRQGKPYHYMEMPRDQRGFMYADKVLKNGKLVGVATSRGYSYHFRQMLSLCTIDVEYSEPGTEVTVVWGNPGEPQRERSAQPSLRLHTSRTTGAVMSADYERAKGKTKNGEKAKRGKGETENRGTLSERF